MNTAPSSILARLKERLMETQTQPQPGPGPNWAYRRRGFSNLLRMGHCAPTVMQTLLDVSSTEKEWLVRLSAGMPGGIGNTGHECGAVTSPLVLLGIHARSARGRSWSPGDLRQGARAVPQLPRLPQDAPVPGDPREGPLSEALHRAGPALAGALPGRSRRRPAGRHSGGTRAGYSRLYSHLVENDFHCAQAVLADLGYTPAEDRELFDATSAFMGGTLFMGRTCSAFTAGVMAIGLTGRRDRGQPPAGHPSARHHDGRRGCLR